eukprot:TRINITY_DN49076_c0_g1_i1.p1 TRINITY_DN49076_c0_g1~~TRINITY_DN49076_c0_g1_i1.p1  ORF type:complete len:251 (-),score=48.89 TRINITY_DN49076_c0_g1_i1:52-804(-)
MSNNCQQKRLSDVERPSDVADQTVDMWDQTPTLYLNVWVAEIKEAEFKATVQQEVQKKVPNPFGFGILKKAVGSIAGTVAATFVDTKSVAAKIAAKIPNQMPSKMAEMGIDAFAEESFRHGAFVVIRISVAHIDVPKILSSKGAAKASSAADCALGCLKGCLRLTGRQELLAESAERKAASKIVDALCQKLPQEMPKKLAEAGIVLDMVAKSSEEQTAYFYKALEHLGINNDDAVREQESSSHKHGIFNR